MSDVGSSPLKRALRAIDDLQARLASAEKFRHEPLAIIGLGCRLPGGADNPESFWNLLRDGVDAITEVPPDRWKLEEVFDPDQDAPGKTYTRWGGFLRSVDGFDPQFFGIAPREAVDMDPQQRILLEVAWEALENAGQAPDLLEETKTGVYVGVCSNDYARFSPWSGEASRVTPYSASGIAHSVVSGRLSYILGLRGPAISVDTACSSSLVALHLACQGLRMRDCRMAITGGVHLMLAPDNTIAFCRTKMMSPTGRCKTFAAAADGFVLGEGCGIVVLKRLSDAVADGDRVLAVIRGIAANQDGASGGLTVPNGPSQEAVIRAALEDAGLSSNDVAYVEGHGTGTTLGDPIEVRALNAALGKGRALAEPLIIGSVKTNLGHLEAGAGVTSVIKVVLSLLHGEIPPHLHAETLSPLLPWEEMPIEVPSRLRGWPEERRRIAGVSGFGFSGTNVHVLIEEAPPGVPQVPASAERPFHLMTVSARTPVALRSVAGAYADRIAGGDDPIPDIAFSANRGRAHGLQRRAIVAASREDLVSSLRSVAEGREDERVVRGELGSTDQPKIAFLFTGQGAQYSGMGRRLYDTQPTFRRALEECAAILRGHLDRPLLDLLHDPRCAALLGQTAYTQPALFSLEYALAELWRSWGVLPNAVLGHSLGEFVAACVAGVFGLEDALKLVTARGRLMQSLEEPGTMSTVFAEEGRVAEAMSRQGGRVAVAGINAPGSVVISGAVPDVDALCSEFSASGVKCKKLFVSHAFHSPLMDPILEEFGRIAERIPCLPPGIPLVSNVTGESFRAGEIPDAEYWVRHARRPVRFAASIEGLHRKGYRLFLEIGPRPTLSFLGQQTVGDDSAAWLPSMREGQDEWQTILASLTALYVRGTRIDWGGFDRDYRRKRISLPTYPFERSRYWVERLPAPAASRGAGESGGNPLLGQRLESPAIRDLVFRSRLSPAAPAFIGEHRVFDVVVLPGTAYIEMILAAAGSASDGTYAGLRDLAIHEAMIFGEEEVREVQVVVDPPTGTDPGIRVYSRSGGGDGEFPWTLHTSARLSTVSGTDAVDISLEEARRRCDREVPGESLQAHLRKVGIALGPRFLGIAGLWCGTGEALARVVLPAPAAAEEKRYRFHPAWLDACVQTLAGAMGVLENGADPAVYMPIGIDSVEVRESPRGTLWSHAAVTGGAEGKGETVVGNVTVYGGDGRVVARLTGIALKKADRKALARIAGRLPDEAQGWLYEPSWEPAPIAFTSSGESAIAGFDTTDAVRAFGLTVSDRAAREGFSSFSAVEPELDREIASFIVRAFERLGQPWEPGTVVSTGPLVDRLGVLPRFGRLVDRFVDILAAQGLVAREGSSWRVLGRPSPDPSPEARCASLAKSYPPLAAEIGTVLRCGPFLSDVLRGERDPLGLLFPGGSLDAAEELYRRSAASRTFNGLVADIVGEAVKAAGDRRVSVLEIGGGTGGTTAHLVPRLPEDRVEYLFTDISPAFTARAQREFGVRGGFRSQPLDIEKDPGLQGLSGKTFDVVVCANVLHATRDLAKTLGHVRSLLAPGGLLALVEVVRPIGWVDVTFGLTEGWWRFEDTSVRPSYPLLTADGWVSLLGRTGFTDAATLPASGSDAERGFGEVVVIARAPAVDTVSASAESETERSDAARWLVLSDRGGVGDRLADRLRKSGGDVTIVGAGESNGDITKWIGSGGGSLARSWKGVVHLWGLDCAPSPGTTPDTLLEDASTACGGALHLLQGLAGESSPPKVWFITRGARSVGDACVPVQPVQALLWGFGRSAALEHPEWRITNVDLSPEIGPDDISTLLAELSADDGEERIAWRPEGRFAERLVRRRDADRRPAGDGVPGGPYGLTIGVRGVLDNLRWRDVDRLPPQEGEVEIEAEATGLNFRDVLNAMGLYPGAHPPFGSECAGRVVAVGKGVEHVRVDDPVVAIAPDSFRRFVIAPAAFVRLRPVHLPTVESVTAPIAYVTASFALEDVARIAPGERVLIHSAAGGVGLAAVHLARSAGAEIFATAGSGTKREYLRSLGIRHVMDSRSTDFAGQIMEATGGEGVHVVLNSLAGEAIPKSLAVLSAGGRFVELGKRGTLSAEEVSAVRPDVHYEVIDWGATAQEDPDRVARVFGSVMDRVFRGELPPLPFRVFPAARVVDAFRHMNRGRHMGKVVVTHPSRRRIDPRDTVPVRTDATYLVTGGLGGLGLLTASWLVERGARHLVLVGRREPDATAGAAIREMESAGASVRTVSADVADAGRMRELLRELVDGAPPLRGIVHSAGVLDDGVLTQLDWNRFGPVLAPKVTGAWILHEATLRAPLDFFVLYSSIASLFGSAGQSNHAAANAFLDSLAWERRALGVPAVSINWGAWAEVGAAARRGVGERVDETGIGGIPPAEGMEILGRLLNPERPQVGVVVVDWPRFLERTGSDRLHFYRGVAQARRAPDEKAAEAPPVTWQEELAGLPAGNRLSLLESRIAEKAVRVLGIEGGQPPDPRRPLQEMGLDSLMAVELRNALAQGAGRPLPSTLLFDHPTIEALVAFLAPLLGAGQEAGIPTGATSKGPGEAHANVVSRIEEMSDEEVDRLLAERTGKGSKTDE